jgi:hypothetical protein
MDSPARTLGTRASVEGEVMPDTVDTSRFGAGDEARRERLVENERRMRRLNRRIEELNRVALMLEDEEDGEQARFLCECSLPECDDRLDLAVEDFASLHEGGDRFVLVPGHEIETVDRVLLRREDCLVVCKI